MYQHGENQTTVTVETFVSWVAGRVPGQSEPDTEVLLLLAAGILVGLGMIYYGFRNYRVSRLIKNTPTERIRSAAVGRTELHGTAVPKEYIFDQPFTDGECLYASYKVREYHEYNDDDKDDEWKTIFSKTLAPPFYLDDGTGEILVDADADANFEISDENSTTIRVSKRRSPPETVQEFLGGPDGTPTRNVTSTITDVLGGVTGNLTNSGHATQYVEQAAQEREESEQADTTGSDESSDDESTSDDLGIQQLSRGELNRSGAILATDDDTQVEDSGADGGASGLLGSIRDAAETMSDAMGSMSGPRGVSGSSRRKRRYIQEVLPIGTDTYVYGGAEPRTADISAANEDRLVMREDSGTGQFIVSDYGEDEIVWGYTKRAVLFGGIGLVVSAGSVGLLAHLLGL